MKHILVPTDLSDFGRITLRWADLFRAQFGSRITLVLVNEPYYPIDVMEMPASAVLLNSPEIRERLEEELQKFAAENAPDGELGTMVVDGIPAPAVIETAKKIDADLILMGTHGRHGLSRLLLGSVAESVLHHSDRPVCTISKAAAQRDPRIARIACPVNFTSIAARALEQATVLAQAFGAELLLVYVSENGGGVEFEKWAAPIVQERARITRVVARGDAASEVLREVEAADADLIVIGAQHRRFRDATVIGATTERVVRFATRPVLTVIAGAGGD